MTASPTRNSPAAAFEQTIRKLSHRRQTWQVFSDFCEAAAMALANAAAPDAEREARYLQVVSRYEREELQQLCELLAHVGVALETERCDFLGERFMRLGLGNHWHGQFFTPWPVASLMARMTFDRETAQRAIESTGFVTVMEPACGAGAMVIAFADAMEAEGFDPHRHLHATAVDVDQTAAQMCFIQLAQLDIPAVVYVGNSLSREVREAYCTPAHHLGAWDMRLRLRACADVAASSGAASSREPVRLLPPPRAMR
jgi:hypothetical protein